MTLERESQSINQSISTNHLHKNDQWLTNEVKNNKTKIKPKYHRAPAQMWMPSAVVV